MYTRLKRLTIKTLGYRRARALRDHVVRTGEQVMTWCGRGPTGSDGRKAIDNLKDLDLELRQVDQAFAVSDDEGRKALDRFCYVIGGNLPPDPYSPEYHAAQMRRYHMIAGRDFYSAADNEQTELDVEQAKRVPFPYSTRSAMTVGDQLMAQGFIIKVMGLPRGARIVEFGPGWGNLTLHLAQMGYHVTAVEISSRFIELIQRQAAQVGQTIELVHGDMLGFNPTEKFDAACFFESFHHCSDHLKLVRHLHDVIAEEGLVAFCGEPIVSFPYPWGLRLDGFSVWSIRRYGWLELGFDLSYFLRTLLFLGWTPKHHSSGFSQTADVIVARKSKLCYTPGEISLPPDEERTWAEKQTTPAPSLRFSMDESVMSCARDVDARQVEFCLSNYAPFDLKVTLFAGGGSRSLRVPAGERKRTCIVPVRNWQGQILVKSQTWSPAQVAGSADTRPLGIAVESFRIIC